MTLSIWTDVAQVTMSFGPCGRAEAFVVRRAGAPAPLIVLETYDAGGLVAAGEVVVWELNQAIAALIARASQARRLALREDGRGHPGHLDVVCGDGDGDVELVVTSRDGRRVVFGTTSRALATDLNAVLHHYLAMTRASGPRTIVLPDVPMPVSGAAAPSLG